MEESTQPGERERGRDGGREMRHKIGRERERKKGIGGRGEFHRTEGSGPCLKTAIVLPFLPITWQQQGKNGPATAPDTQTHHRQST